MSASSIFGSYEEIKTRLQDIPPNYLILPFAPATGVGIIQWEQFSRDEIIPKDAPLWVVHSEGKTFRTSRFIKVNVYRDGDFFFAENETLLVCGVGDSAWEAVEDLELHIVHFRNYYKNLPWERIMGDARRLKQLYENLLTEVE
jgi:hypothetical protein